MSKKSVIITIVIAFLVVAAALTTLVVILNNKTITNISCDANGSKCTYVVKNGFGSASEIKSFSRSELMQCNLETIYEKDEQGNNIPQAYELNMHLDNGNDVIKIKTVDKDKVKKVCPDIIQQRAFNYEFEIIK